MPNNTKTRSNKIALAAKELAAKKRLMTITRIRTSITELKEAAAVIVSQGLGRVKFKTRITTVEQADCVTLIWLLDNVDFDQAKARWECPFPSNVVQFRCEFEMPTLGTWRLDPTTDEFSVLVDIPVVEFEPSENEWDKALKFASTRQYIIWQKQGYAPPPLEVVKTATGKLISLNRRRWLAARAAGVKSLYCWYSGTCHPSWVSCSLWNRKAPVV